MGSIWAHWHAHPDALIGLSFIEGVYLICVGPIREKYHLAEKADPRQTATFTFGVMVIFVSLLSPLHVLSDQYLFSAHMFQHVLLTLVAPPLLVIGMPNWLLRRILRPDAIFILLRVSTYPIVAFLVFTGMFSIWHIPALYNLSVTNHGIHILEHVLFMSAAVLMWWPVTSTMPELPRLSYPLQIIYFFLLSIAQLILFAPIAFAREPIYEWYAAAPRIWSVSAVSDQQIGAIIMKMGGGGLFMVLIIITFFKWFNSEGKTRTEVSKTRDLLVS